MMQRFGRIQGLVLLAILACTVPSCTSGGPPPPGRPDMVKRARDKALVSFDVFLDPSSTEVLTALRALEDRKSEFTTWAALLVAWRASPPLESSFDVDQKIRAQLDDDLGWVAQAKEAFPPDGRVPDAIYLEGLFQAITDWLGRNG